MVPPPGVPCVGAPVLPAGGRAGGRGFVPLVSWSVTSGVCGGTAVLLVVVPMMRVSRSGVRCLGEPRGSARGGENRVVWRARAMRVDAAAVRQQLTGVFEGDDAVAEKAPALLWERRDDAGGVAVEGVCGGAGRLVLAHRTRHGFAILRGVSLRDVGSATCWPCVVSHMTKHARYISERRTFEQVTLKTIQIRPNG